MYKHTAEALVCLAHTDRLKESLCMHIRKYCGSIKHLETGHVLDFGEAEAVISSTEGALLFRVSARDIFTFYGVRTLLHGSLSAIAPISDEAIEWLPAGAVPFGTLRGHIQNGQRRTGGQ
ncbi:SMa0974 family conjugal transfer regulator [Sinorhizobium meliloti]|uniref:SMa0974 family conjugal transfer regulator n=1 Tax=Rhizobium meliloti TaxID=382 RepID=UPI0004828A07|nr:hypothetical protein CN240_31580 [Sinorhizobium meliloti]RVG40757.1 hypothetical protein CN227_31555 [Sinorhizobium meliloti]RVI61587.1 hypothetical protein CN187_29620 [Sinorhizobium meliloti]RVM03245.1 hypothetical protein CN125_30905 [Sinorhizobium meliloti]RVM41943.1 hypothetical protein CN121_28250 [Sinorhizobium meliloti]